tara:strand:+ start:124 stop:282 length:159 start_codon:yes stop_codon:yes gene_type:complete
MNSVYKIRYQDSMTTHLLHESFNTTEEAELFIALNLGESSVYEVEEVSDDKY